MLNTILYILVVVFIIWCLYDLFTGTMKRDKKILWAILIILLPLIGSLLYYFIGRK
ncbi:MAG: PLDc N-terminal domain-containing protein [Cyclobacteriaceae bacterium]